MNNGVKGWREGEGGVEGRRWKEVFKGEKIGWGEGKEAESKK